MLQHIFLSAEILLEQLSFIILRLESRQELKLVVILVSTQILIRSIVLLYLTTYRFIIICSVDSKSL
jgi:hypothetical protein